jgi:hypothetical protein
MRTLAKSQVGYIHRLEMEKAQAGIAARSNSTEREIELERNLKESEERARALENKLKQAQVIYLLAESSD